MLRLIRSFTDSAPGRDATALLGSAQHLDTYHPSQRMQS